MNSVRSSIAFMYTSDLTYAQFNLIKQYLPHVKRTRPRKYSELDLLNSILYVLNNGIKWREIPPDFPPWSSVYKYFRKLTVLKILDFIQLKLNRFFSKGLAVPMKHLLITDSQSVRCTNMLIEKAKGRDGNKKIKGLKRFVLCTVNGTVEKVFTTPANTSEKTGLLTGITRYYYTKARNKQFKCILADKGFESKPLQNRLQYLGFTLYSMKSTKRLKNTTEYDIQQNNLHNYQNKQISKLRWVVEQVFAHLDNHRRIIICYERTTQSHEAFVKLASIRLMVRKLRK
jgi:putative transposase